jgi:hypothetical protein
MKFDGTTGVSHIPGNVAQAEDGNIVGLFLSIDESVYILHQ